MNTISNCNITMNLDSSLAADQLSRALLIQAQASLKWNEAALELARSLKPTDICAIRVTEDSVKVSGEFKCEE